jgi:hypothetical protein
MPDEVCPAGQNQVDDRTMLLAALGIAGIDEAAGRSDADRLSSRGGGVGLTDAEALRRQLDELADETPEVSPQEWLAGTRHKVRVRRRVRVIGAIGAIALALAVARAVVPRILDNLAPRPVEPVPTPDGQGAGRYRR